MYTLLYIYIYIYVYIYIIRAISIISANKNNILVLLKTSYYITHKCYHLYISTIFNINYIFVFRLFHNIFEQICYIYTSISIIGIHGSSKE